MCSLFVAVLFVCHRAHLRIDMLSGSVLAEVTDNHSIPLIQSGQYLNSIGTLDSRMNLALFHMVLRIDQKQVVLSSPLLIACRGRVNALGSFCTRKETSAYIPGVNL